MIFEVKAQNDHGHEVVIYRRHSFLEAIFDVFSLSGRACAVDVYKEEDLTRERVMRVTIY